MEKIESKEFCWEAGSLLPIKLFRQDIECLIAFLKAEGQKIQPWKKKEENWKAQLQKLLAENQNPTLTETEEEVLLEEGLDLITELLMTLSSCYEKQGVLPQQEKEYLMIINTSPFEREDMIESEGLIRIYSAGQELPAQWTEETTLWQPTKIPPYGFRVFETRAAEQEQRNGTICFHPETLTMETPYYLVRFNKAMEFVSIFEKQSQSELLCQGTLGNVLWSGENKIDQVVDIKIEESGAVRTILQIVKQFRESYVIQNLVFYEHSKRIEIQTYCLWKETTALLETTFFFAKEPEKQKAALFMAGEDYLTKECDKNSITLISAEDGLESEVTCFLFPYGESKEDIWKEQYCVSNSLYQLTGQIPFTKEKHCFF